MKAVSTGKRATTHGTGIAWTHGDGFKGETWNPVTGCSHVSDGCRNCYAEDLTARFAGTPGWIEEHRPWTAPNAAHNVRLRPERLDQPLRWTKPRMVFVNSMSDVFHELVPADYICRMFAVMSRAEQHVFQILTKRPERARELAPEIAEYLGSVYENTDLSERLWPLSNVWMGVSIEDARHTGRADVLREIPAAVRFVSAEPLLGSLLDVPRLRVKVADRSAGTATEHTMVSAGREPLDLTGIDQVIVGGESGGRKARPMHPEWARELRRACLYGWCPTCRSVGADLYDDEEGKRRVRLCPDCPPIGETRPAFFFKQWGSWVPYEPDAQPPFWNGQDGETIDGHILPAGLSENDPIDGWWCPDPDEEPIYRYAGAAPTSGGHLLDGAVWREMPESRR